MIRDAAAAAAATFSFCLICSTLSNVSQKEPLVTDGARLFTGQMSSRHTHPTNIAKTLKGQTVQVKIERLYMNSCLIIIKIHDYYAVSITIINHIAV